MKKSLDNGATPFSINKGHTVILGTLRFLNLSDGGGGERMRGNERMRNEIEGRRAQKEREHKRKGGEKGV